jgi:DNA-binding transcriptional LysR family regulator
VNQLHLINVFVAVVDAGGFAGAARKLALSPSAVTRAINELENYLGMRLLTRTTRTMRMTEPGARYVEDCRRILADLEQTHESMIGLHATPRGRLAITAPAMFGARFMTPIITEYLQRFSEVNASCHFVDRATGTMDDGVDIAIRLGALPDSSMQAICVGRVRHVICGSRAYLDRHGRPQSPEDLAAHCIVASGAAGQHHEWPLVEDGALRVHKLEPRMMTSSDAAAALAALDGFGLTRLPSFEVDDHLREGRLETVLNSFAPPPMPVHLLHREGRHASPKTRAFLDLAIERLRAHPALNEPAPRPEPVPEPVPAPRPAARPVHEAWPRDLMPMGPRLVLNAGVRAARVALSALS